MWAHVYFLCSLYEVLHISHKSCSAISFLKACWEARCGSLWSLSIVSFAVQLKSPPINMNSSPLKFDRILLYLSKKNNSFRTKNRSIQSYKWFSLAFNTIIPTLLQTKLTQLSVPSSICQWIISFLTDRQQLVRMGKFMSNSHFTNTGTLPLRAVFSPHCSSPCTPTTAPLKTPLSSSWSLQTTPHSSASSRTGDESA